MSVTQAQADWVAEAFTKIVNNVGYVLMGKERQIRLVLVALFSEGHVLIEDKPGTGKTTLAEAIAASISTTHARVQFTPDLTPDDLLGKSIYAPTSEAFEFFSGPVFASILLVERINRGSPRLQTSLMEAMDERSVRDANGELHPLEKLFFVIATQNPASSAGMAPLEDEQLDRFLMKISLGYPDNVTAVRLLENSGESKREATPIMRTDVPLTVAALASDMFLHPRIADYINSLVRATHENHYVRVGVSMRGALGLARASKAWALSKGRTYVIPEDLRDVIVPVLAHRIVISEDAHEIGLSAEEIIERVLLDVDPPAPDDETVLPGRVDIAELRGLADVAERGLLIGLGGDPIAAQTIDVDSHPHLLLTGGRETGKTTALRSYASELCRLYEPGGARIFILETRNTDLAELPNEYLGTHAVGEVAARRTLHELAAIFSDRLGDGEASEAHDDWNGLEGFVLIDDIDELLGSGSEALAEIANLVQFGSRVGMHIIATRSEVDPSAEKDSLYDLLSSGRLTSLALGPIPGRTRMEVKGGTVEIQLADSVAAPTREMSSGAGMGPSSRQSELVDLLGVQDVRAIDFERTWMSRPERDFLRVPVGLTVDGTPLILDLKESAKHGMGPHGLIVGSTGSGKSELLRTLVLALAMSHSPEDLSVVYISPDGPGPFAGLEGMPHVSAIISHLRDDNELLERLSDSLNGEIQRRQELLRASGKFSNVSDYRTAQLRGRTDLPPLPDLLIIVDEFTELLGAKPELVETLLALARAGRSLNLHLIMSTQRLGDYSLHGLDEFFSFQIALRTFSAAESRRAINVPDASTLSPLPGTGILKVDATTLIEFRAAYVSGLPAGRWQSVRALMEGATSAVEPPVNSDDIRPTWQIAVDRMSGTRQRAHAVWLPLLETPVSLDLLMPDLTATPELGLVSRSWRDAGPLTVPIGIIDVPREQRRETLTVSLTGAAGHMVVVGGPLSGKSTVVRTTIAALALTATPQELQFYVLDFGGGAFEAMRDLPHLRGVTNRSEPDVVKRMVEDMTTILLAREVYFRENGIDSIETYRDRRSAGLVDDGYGDVFLVIDGWLTVRSEFDALESEIQALAARGLTYGVHLIITASRWLEVRSNLKDLLGTRIELRLSDPADSEINRRAANNVPLASPGRGLSPRGLQMLTALPRIDGSSDPGTLMLGVSDFSRKVGAAWSGPAAPKLQSLPFTISLDEVRALAPQDSRILVGVEGLSAQPVGIDPRTESHLYVFGDKGSGKSSILRAYASEITRLYTPQQAKIFVVDYRRSLLGEIPDDYLGSHLTHNTQATDGLKELADFFAARLPGPNVTPEQLRTRTWWTGAEGFILVDDYDLVATSEGNPLVPLVPLLAQAHDVGLHLIVTRRTGGAARAAYDPVIQRLTDMGSTGILLSGSPEEGALIGRVKAKPSVSGRAQIVSRDRGVLDAQLAYSPPRF